MSRPTYILLFQDNMKILPQCIGTREQIIDYLAEYTLGILVQYPTIGEVRYASIWSYYDEHFNTEYTLIYKSLSQIGYLVYPMDSIPNLSI